MASPKEQPSGNVEPMTEEEENSIEHVITAESTPQRVTGAPNQDRKREIKTVHDSLVNDALELVAALFLARSGRKPDADYLAEMRKIYALKGDERLKEETDKLIAELNLISKN